MGGQGGGRINLRLQQAKIEYDLFSFAAIDTILKQQSQLLLAVFSPRELGDECCTKKSELKEEERKENAPSWLSFIQQYC